MRRPAASPLFIAAVVCLLTARVAVASVNRWTSGGPWGGIVRAFAIDPRNPDEIYAASSRGVFKSTNAGVSWSATNTSPPALILSLAIDPQTPTTLYAGIHYQGVFKTTDGGANWSASLYYRTVSRLVVDPADSRVIYAGTDAGVYKSLDGAHSWIQTAVQSDVGPALTIDPGNSLVVYAGSMASPGKIFKTINGGITWAALNVPTIGAILSIGVDPANPLALYAGTGGFGFFRSADGGLTWAQSDLDGAAVFVGDIDISATGVIFLGTNIGVLESTDRGLSWTNLGPPQAGICYSFALDSRGILYVGREDGVYKSIDGGGSWNTASVGLSTSSVLSLAVDPFLPNMIYAGSADFPFLFRTEDGGANWTGGDGIAPLGATYAIAVDPVNRGVLYAGTGYGMWKSIDHRLGWNLIGLPGSNIGYPPGIVLSIAIDPRSATTVFAGTWCCHVGVASGLFKTADGGVTWTDASEGISGFPHITALELSPDASAFYAGTTAGLFKSTDGGVSWSPTTLTPQISAVKIDPATPSTVYAGSFSDGVFKSVDAGATWTPVNQGLTNIQVWAIVIDPSRPGLLYAATDGGGVFESIDAGQTWSALNEGLADLDVLSLALDRTGTLHAGTGERGVFEYTIPAERRLVPPSNHRPPTRTLEPRRTDPALHDE